MNLRIYPCPACGPFCRSCSILGSDKRVSLVMAPRILLRLGADLEQFVCRLPGIVDQRATAFDQSRQRHCSPTVIGIAETPIAFIRYRRSTSLEYAKFGLAVLCALDKAPPEPTMQFNWQA